MIPANPGLICVRLNFGDDSLVTIGSEAGALDGQLKLHNDALPRGLILSQMPFDVGEQSIDLTINGKVKYVRTETRTMEISAMEALRQIVAADIDRDYGSVGTGYDIAYEALSRLGVTR
jgi:hypothetical protein